MEARVVLGNFVNGIILTKGINTCLDNLFLMLMIGIQRSEKYPTKELEILSYFESIGYSHDDDFIFNDSGKVGYLIMDDANYSVFREEDNVSIFTHSIITYIRTLTEFDTITVKENEDDADFIFIGNAAEFIVYWDEMGVEEE